MKGIDVSTLQGVIDWSRVSTDFAMIKATQGRGFTHWMHKLREPGDIDKQIDSYSYSQIMRIAKSARLPEGKSYAKLADMLADLVGIYVVLA